MRKLTLPLFGILAVLFTVSCSTEKVVMHENQWYNPGSVLTSTAPINKAQAIKCQETAAPALVKEGISLNQPVVTANEVNQSNNLTEVLKPVASNNQKIVAEQIAKQYQSAPKMVKKAIAKQAKAAKPMSDIPYWVAIVLCFFIPFVAVGFATDWDATTIIINLLWTLLCGIPGIIHAIIIVSRNKDKFIL
jgi:uncharacterized membrane protein YqaE (UPF0057 family)